MVDKLTPRLGLPVPYLTNPLKIDVGKLTQALTMLDANAVMLTDWDITADNWQKVGTISDLAQGKIGITLMVITGTGFANIVMQTGDGTVTTVGDPARITVTAQTNLGSNEPTILGGKVVETAKDTYEVWFNVAPSTAPRKWSGLLVAGNGAKIDWTHTAGAQPSAGVTILIARSLTDQEIASTTITRNGAVLTAGYAGLMGLNLPTFDFAATGDTITAHNWRVGETMRVAAADANATNGWPTGVTGAGATAWRIHCEGINDDHSVRVFTFASEGATPTWLYRVTRSGTSWSAPRRMYTSDNPPAASEVKAIPQLDTISSVINLNDRVMPAHYGALSITSVTGAVAANNYPFDETGQLLVLPFGASGGVTQLYLAKSGRTASRSYNGSTFTEWRKTANAGANDDITSLTGLSGPLRLGGQGVNDYDAATVGQLKAASGGGGPTMNGVVNNYLGAVSWFMGTRTKMPAGHDSADGQTRLRTEVPEIVAAMKAGYLNVVAAGTGTDAGKTSDQMWQADPKVRGKYSWGDGDATTGTTIRMPDLNGVWSHPTTATLNSIAGLFLRGDGRGTRVPAENGGIGDVRTNAAPNITASISAMGAPNWQTPQGAFSLEGSGAQASSGGSAQWGQTSLIFKASNSNPTYSDAATEVRPNSVQGIWLIRVGSSFSAANTNFNVYTGEATLPGSNTQIRGGAIRSIYQVAGVDHMSVEVRAQGIVGGVYTPVIEMISPSGGSPVTRTWSLPQGAGELALSNDSRFGTLNGKTGGVITGDVTHRGGTYWIQGNSLVAQSVQNGDGTWPTVSPAHSCLLTNRVANAGQPGGWFFMNMNENVGVDCYGALYLKAAGVDRTWLFAQNGNAIAPNGSWINNSDERIKTDIARIADPLAKMRMMRGVTYNRLDGALSGQGFIAQEVQKVFPNAVFKGGDTTLKDGSVIKGTLAVDVVGVAAALHHEAILALLTRIEALEQQLASK